jgi:hypothetical protein
MVEKTLWLPVFHVGKKRIRARVRLISWRGFHAKTDLFPNKRVYRAWLGFILVTALVDDHG